jgi:hypothetical protein
MKTFRLPLLLYLTLVFLSGAVVGVLGHRFYAERAMTAKSRPPSPQEMRRQYVEDLRTRLKLRPEQSQRLGEILEATGKRFHETRKKWDPELRAIQDDQANQIRAMLDEVQRTEYEKMRQERDRHRRRGRP